MIHSGKHEELICELYPFMASDKPPIYLSNKKNVSNENKYFFSRNNDNLMYCIYLVVKNTLDINDFKTNFNKVSPSLKETAITKCRLDNGVLLKSIRQSKNEFINSIFSMNKLDWQHFYGMCLYNDMVIVVIKKKIAYIYGDIDVHEIKGCITITENHTLFEYNSNIVLDDFFVIQNPLKPIRPISNYKLVDLKTICDKLDIEHDGMKKNDIYTAISREINE